MKHVCIDCGERVTRSGDTGRYPQRCPIHRDEHRRRYAREARRRYYAADPERYRAAARERAKHTQRCSYVECGNPRAYADGLCVSHRSRLVRTGSPDGLVQRKKRDNIDANGYRRYRRNGVHVLEHRAVMEAKLRRPLWPDENVHHKNGDRLDNRPENLELWSTKQPPGQRVEDKIQWALDLLRRYAPELLAESGRVAA